MLHLPRSQLKESGWIFRSGFKRISGEIVEQSYDFHVPKATLRKLSDDEARSRKTVSFRADTATALLAGSKFSQHPSETYVSLQTICCSLLHIVSRNAQVDTLETRLSLGTRRSAISS